MTDPFVTIYPKQQTLPIIVSVPHCGVMFPDEVKQEMDSSLIEQPDDTDWFVDKLYDFAPAMGIVMIKAVYHRWVIDLNRTPDSQPLYHDGRIITELCPTTTFLNEPIYIDKRKRVEQVEVARRLGHYYWPYHKKLEALIASTKARFSKALLWDCHSIRQIVPTIQQAKFPDLILGSADEKSASPDLIAATLRTLSGNNLNLHHNTPFKGGFITRHFGKPEKGEHALQLEMTKVNYMDDDERNYDIVRAERVRNILRQTFEALAQMLV